MQTAFIVTWSHVIPGREKAVADYAVEVADFWGKAAADGKCTEPEFFFGSTGKVYWMVKGDYDDLFALEHSEPGQKLLMKGALILKDFGSEFFRTGADADKYVETFFAVAGELGYA